MIDNVVNINFQDKNGYSYLHATAQSKFIEGIKKLLMKGVNVYIRDKFVKMPLMVAVLYTKIKINSNDFIFR